MAVVLRTSRHLDWREGEAQGGRGTRRQRSPALPRAPERVFGRHPRLFRALACPLVSGCCRGSKQWESGIGCLVCSLEESGGGERGEILLSKEEKWVSAPLTIAA